VLPHNPAMSDDCPLPNHRPHRTIATGDGPRGRREARRGGRRPPFDRGRDPVRDQEGPVPPNAVRDDLARGDA